MTAPLNGSLLNGSGTSFFWAWGQSAVTANATVEPVIFRAYRNVGAVSSAKAKSSAVTDRLAFLNSEQQPVAETSAQIKRYADFNGAATSGADFSVLAVRYAWAVATPAEQVTSSNALPVIWKFQSSSASGETQISLQPAAVTAFRYVTGKGVPALARSWAPEDLVEKIRVRQIQATASPVARSRTRSLANTALGFSVVAAEGLLQSNNLSVNIYHAFFGVLDVSVAAEIDPSRVRIIVGGMLATATANAAPTVTTPQGRFSYNAATTQTHTASSAINSIIRAVPSAIASANSVLQPPVTFFVRDGRGVIGAGGGSTLTSIVHTKHRVKGVSPGASGTTCFFNRYRWVPAEPRVISSSAVSSASSTVQAYNGEVVFEALASAICRYSVQRRHTDTVATPTSNVSITFLRKALHYGQVRGTSAASGTSERSAFLSGISFPTAEGQVYSTRYGKVTGSNASLAAAAGRAERTAKVFPVSVPGTAVSAGDNGRLTFANEAGMSTSASVVASKAVVLTIRSFTASTNAVANEFATPLRIVSVVSESVGVDASVSELMYRLNIDALAPNYRTAQVSQQARFLNVPANVRGYTV